MKLRTDFVTNSSSSSFILARKRELSEEQKQAIVDYVEDNFLGNVLLTPDSTEEKIKKVIEYQCEEYEDEIRKALKEGKTIYSGDVIFDGTEGDYAEIFDDIWHELERCSDFDIIDGDLSY